MLTDEQKNAVKEVMRIALDTSLSEEERTEKYRAIPGESLPEDITESELKDLIFEVSGTSYILEQMAIQVANRYH